MSGVSEASPPMAIERDLPASGLAEATLLRVLVPLATMLTIGALAFLPLLTPLYMHPALDAAGSAAKVGLGRQATYDYSDRTVSELVFGPASFDFAAPDGSAFYDAAERGHMRDAQTVLYIFLGLAALAAVLLLVVGVRRRADAALLRAIGRGGAWLAVGTIVVGVIAAVAFDAAFELFHRLLFPGGNFTFNQATERLVQLYPLEFFQLTAAVLGGLLVAGGLAVWLAARRLTSRPPLESRA
jgi:hypothetical protein